MLKQNIDGAKSTLKRYDFPVDVAIESIAICNLQCIMCPQAKLTRERGIMHPDVYKKIIDEVAQESPTTRIWLALMGEATLLKSEICRRVKYASDKGLNVNFNTNAVLLDPNLADELIDSNPNTIYIGLDATTEETYNKVRIGGDFNKVVANAEYLIKHKRPEQTVIMQFIEMFENCHETEEFKEYWLSKGVPVKLRPRLGWGVGVGADNLMLSDKERFPCQWLLRTCSIHWDGRFAQCDGDFNTLYSPGDIRMQTIKEVWNGELAKRREWHWTGDFTHLPCSECKDWQAGRSYFYYPEGDKCQK